jgi:hypothetical protein
MEDFQDIEIRCVTCAVPFTWSAHDQAFYAERQLDQPKRCKPCRQARKLKWESRQAPRNPS